MYNNCIEEQNTIQQMALQSIQNSVSAIAQLGQSSGLAFLENCTEALVRCFRSGNKVLIAGNGGSLCDAAHFAEEFTGFFRGYRPALPVIAITEPGHITCTGNDIGFEWVFSRAIEAYGKLGDLFIGLTTSGNSANLLHAFNTAKQLGLGTIALLGRDGGKLRNTADYQLIIEDVATSDRIQEAHMTALHILIELTLSRLFPQDG